MLRVMIFALTVLIGGCSTTMPPNVGSTAADPYERFNRRMFEFNDRVDRNVLKPVAEVYNELPMGVRTCVSNIFGNLAEVPNAINDVLQGKPGAALNDVCRLVINSTVGLAGCFDVAKRVGLPRNQEDFGQTLGAWGAGPGSYIVLPFLGPSNVRDGWARLVDIYTDPLSYLTPTAHRYVGEGVKIVDLRASLLEAEGLVAGAALDRYNFIRDAYLQRRRSLVYDGEPPRLKFEDDDAPDDPSTPAPLPDAAVEKPSGTPVQVPEQVPMPVSN